MAKGLQFSVKKLVSRTEMEKYFARAVSLTEIIGPFSNESIDW